MQVNIDNDGMYKQIRKTTTDVEWIHSHRFSKENGYNAEKQIVHL